VSAGPPDDPNTHVLKLLGGKWVSAAISAAASLGVFDALLDEPRTAERLAPALECDPPMLTRLVGVLVAEGLLAMDAADVISVTELGRPLRRGALGELAVFSSAPFSWNPWSLLAPAIRTGATAFELLHGASLFDYLESRPEQAEIYHRAVDAFTRLEAIALAETYDFAGVKSLVDVGGGRGTLLVEVLKRHPNMHGVLLEREAVAAAAERVFADEGLKDRTEVVVGSFLENVPRGADVYVIKHVLHNWPDDEAIGILARCRDALAPGGRVLVVEGLMLPPAYRDATRLLDLEMMTLLGPARERTKPEFRKLLREAGLKLESSHDLAGTTRLLVTAKLG
jgi:SAM-dependent methyltransferase